MKPKEKVILFGRGMVYQKKKEALFRDYEVEVFLDNGISLDQDSVTDEETGIPVVNPTEINQYPNLPVILLSYALGEMYQQLLDLGVEKNRIRFGPFLKPYNTFEKMLFEKNGKLVWEEGALFYENEEFHLHKKTDPSNLEHLTKELQDTPLYPKSQSILKELPLYPLDDTYGMNRGTPVDRYYIEQFLESQKRLIQGTVMEIGDRTYTEKFGEDRVNDSIILHVEKEDPGIHQIKGNFATGEGLQPESIDCLICTQTLPFIYDLPSAVAHIVEILKKGGTALITVGGISQIIQYEKIHYGHFWSFTDQSLKRLFEEQPEVESATVFTYGNVKSATAFLYGISYEELDKMELDVTDPNYQLIVAAVIKKKEIHSL